VPATHLSRVWFRSEVAALYLVLRVPHRTPLLADSQLVCECKPGINLKFEPLRPEDAFAFVVRPLLADVNHPLKRQEIQIFVC